MRRWASLAALLSAAALAYPVEVIQSSGPPEKRIDIAVLGDGYRDADQAKLSDDARTAIEGLFSITPYREYRGLFNVKLVHVVSRENGADDGSYGAARDTALDASYGCQNTDRLLCVDPAKAVQAAMNDVPEYDFIVVVVNDPKYGGSGGSLTVISTAPAAVNLLRHELSHSVAELADEYEASFDFPACDPQADCPEPNATVRSTRGGAKWASWIDSSTPVPTPAGQGLEGIGLYEGCRYEAKGVYRPKDEGCLMRSFTSTPSFCSVCSEGLVRAFWRRASAFDGLAPAADAPLDSCQANTFSVTHPPIAESQWWHLWSVDGVPQAGDSTSFTLPADPSLSYGPHKVELLAEDRTPLVRGDPDGRLGETAGWTVKGCTPGPCDVTASCDGATCERTFQPAGTSCAKARCEGGRAYGPASCDASGSCASGSVACAPYACDPNGPSCLTSCTADADCDPAGQCRSGACVPRPTSAKAGSCGGCGEAGGLGGWAALAAATWWRRRRRARGP